MSPAAIKRLRKSLGLTQEQFAGEIGAHRVTVADWETGAHQPRGLYIKALQQLAEMSWGKKTKKRRRQTWTKSKE